MRNSIIIAFILLTFGMNAQEKKNKNARYSVEVNGNCDQCKKRIEKTAYGVSGVKSAVWSTNDHMLQLLINEEKTSLTAVEQAVAKVGHDTENVKASDEDYKNLHSCCLYERK